MSIRVDAGDGRSRQGKRDEQIRRKLELELNKRTKRSAIVQEPKNHSNVKSVSAGVQGSVMSLKPMPPVTMPVETPVIDAAQYMTAYRASCVLVLDADSAVCGIFTAKDLAFKVVAASAESGRDLRRTLTVGDIMTPQPTCANIDSSATEALNVMVSRGFRHLPIMDKKGEIAGILDITKCFFEAMRKLERACESSQKLRDALDGVNGEFGSMHPQKILSYVEALKEHTTGPQLGTVFDESMRPIYVDVRASVTEAAQLMKANKTTSILVTDRSSIAGIFTSKDIVLRVLAANLDPKRCSVVRVMTPNPECAPTTMTIQEALRKMHDGKFLNLPVKNEADEIFGIVDVLSLTYATLEHLNGMTSIETPDEEGPAWNKFWMSLEGDTESEGASNVYPHGFEDLDNTSSINVSDSELAQFSIPEGFEGAEQADSTSIQIDSSVASDHIVDAQSRELLPEDSLSRLGISDSVSTSASTMFSFKFRAPSGRAHRVQVQKETAVEAFRALIAAKLSSADLDTLGGLDSLAVSYVDDDKDVISITTEVDIQDSIEVAKRNGVTRAEIYLHHPDQTPEIRSKSADSGNEGGMVPMLVGSAAAVMFGFLAWGKK